MSKCTKCGKEEEPLEAPHGWCWECGRKYETEETPAGFISSGDKVLLQNKAKEASEAVKNAKRLPENFIELAKDFIPDLDDCATKEEITILLEGAYTNRRIVRTLLYTSVLDGINEANILNFIQAVKKRQEI